MLLTLAVVGKDQAALDAFDRTHVEDVELVLIANPQREPLSVVGNRYLDSAKTPVVGLVHADTTFGPGSLATFTAAALAGSVVGIVGRDLEYTYRWCNANPGAVSTLDCCSVFVRRDFGLRFDERTFDGLHCHVEDLCLQARVRGIPVLVPSADATHRGSYGLIPWAPWIAEYQVYRDRLARKWSHVRFVTT